MNRQALRSSVRDYRNAGPSSECALRRLPIQGRHQTLWRCRAGKGLLPTSHTMTFSPRLWMARKLVLLSCACAVRLADAATFTVLNTDDSGVGSLREAITLANADNTTPRMINFSAAGTITLTSALPQVTKFMTIDATTAPGYAGTPVVTIDGNSGDFDGLTVNAFFTGNANNKTFVKGLCIINCGMNGGTARNGITLVDGDSVTVSGCFIGINAAGTAAARNTAAGIRCELAVATIGGTGTNDRCVISGNLGAGIDGPVSYTHLRAHETP